MRYKVTVEVGKRFEFDDIEADSESDAESEAHDRAMALTRDGEINIRRTVVTEAPNDQAEP